MSEHEKISFLSKAWEVIESAILYSRKDCQIPLSDQHEFRFFQLKEQEFSVVLADQKVNIFHFVWKEVDGALELSHRIVHEDFRRRGIASKMMNLVELRAQRLANESELPYRFGLQTSQLSVINLCRKMGLEMTEGKDYFDTLKFDMEDSTTHLSHKGYRINFSMSKIIHPNIPALAQ
ncbi:MAG: GNAT family N-acetyltransferase [Candidatus Gracilibacteria bacterium]|nr:GNAT family N-acetyltransferase [Candidatus Gracilibacteria bacterium]